MQAELQRVHHFQDLEKQAHAARLGMWIFLGTEVLLFGGLFVGYGFYRVVHPEAWKAASAHLNTVFGTIETFDLVTSSFFMVMAIHFVRTERRLLAVASLGVTILLGLLFLVLHGIEYTHDILEGAMPGMYYHLEELPLRGAAMFYTFYFLMTGLHSIHVIVGVSVLSVLAFFTWRGEYSPGYHNPLENGGLYWHLVDMIWIFLYPLFYLV